MKRLAVFIFALLFAAPALGQVPNTMPPNTVFGRLGAGTSGPGQAIPFATLLAQLSTASGSSVGYIPVAGIGLIPVAPVTGLPLYASPAAAGSGNCLSPSNACTLATACATIRQIATFLGAAGPINLADGTYSTPGTDGSLCHLTGNSGGSSNQLVSIVGDAVTPANVVLQVPVGANGFSIEDGAEVGINHLEITAVNGSGSGINCRQNAVCDYSDIYWGTWGNSGSHVAATGVAVSVNPGSEHFVNSTTFLIHWNLSAGAAMDPGSTSTLGSSVTWSVAFANVANSYLDVAAWTVSGSGTGPQFAGSGSGFLNLPGATSCNSKFPGSGGCAFSQGFQDSNGDGMTGTGIVVGQQAPTITDPTLTPHSYAGLPASPTAGQMSYITDGKASNCGDSACTTFGTAVTGGGGALPLFIWYTGAAWHLVGK